MAVNKQFFNVDTPLEDDSIEDKERINLSSTPELEDLRRYNYIVDKLNICDSTCDPEYRWKVKSILEDQS